MNTVTLVFAVLGLVLSVASLVWQATTFRLSGPRVRVELHVGGMTGAGYGTAPLGEGWERQVAQLAEQGMYVPIAAVVVRNVGRQATTITGFEAATDSGMSFSIMGTPQGCPPLPHRLEAESKALYYLELDHLVNLASVGDVEGITPPRRVFMRVELGSGKKHRTPASFSSGELRAWGG